MLSAVEIQAGVGPGPEPCLRHQSCHWDIFEAAQTALLFGDEGAKTQKSTVCGPAKARGRWVVLSWMAPLFVLGWAEERLKGRAPSLLGAFLNGNC